jgi:DNA-binding NarL/FixJ family response regulator
VSTQTNRDFALVVDDTPETLRVLTDALEEAGLIVIVARTGEKAIELAERMAPDIILMDAVMPGLDGFETCRRLKQRKELVHVPVIFMTGLSETEHIIKGLRAGGVDYVTKPIVPDELIARIGVHIANARLAQSARAALDAAGRSLMAVTRDLDVRWCTPRAAVLCDRAGFARPDGGLQLPQRVKDWVGGLISSPQPRPTGGVHGNELDLADIHFVYMGQTGPDEYLFRIADKTGPGELEALQTELALTPREAEVLLWISQGKSNRDIGDILDLSPRTVNKHLEQIFAKLGVENRTAAAALAVRTVVSASSS